MIITGVDSGIGIAVAPGPIWTPLIRSSFNSKKDLTFIKIGKSFE